MVIPIVIASAVFLVLVVASTWMVMSTREARYHDWLSKRIEKL